MSAPIMSYAPTAIPSLTRDDLEKVGYHTRPVDEAVISFVTNPGIEHRTLLLRGAPGVGKTEFGKALARAISAKTGACSYIEYLTHSWTSNEHLFVGPNVQNIAVGVSTPEQAIIKGVLWRAAERSLAGPVVVLLDEFEKCQQRTETLLLGYLQDGRVQDSDPNDVGREVYANMSNLIVVLTSNDERDLMEATMRRCYRYEMEYLSPAVEISMLRKWTGCPVGAITAVVSAANVIRTTRGSSVSAQEMRNLLIASRPLPSEELIAHNIKCLLMKNTSDLSPKEIAALAVTLFSEFSVKGAK